MMSNAASLTFNKRKTRQRAATAAEKIYTNTCMRECVRRKYKLMAYLREKK